MNTQTDTPETDAARQDGYTFEAEDLRPAIDFARKLERERDEWQRTARSYGKKIETMREAIEIAFRRVDFAIINHNLDGETSLEHMKQARTQLKPLLP